MAKKKIVKVNVIRMVEQKKILYVEHGHEWDEDHLNTFSVAEQPLESQFHMLKTLVVMGDVMGSLVAAISEETESNLKKLAKVSGDKRVEVFHLKDLEATTGYIHGDCLPIGMKKLFPTYLNQVTESYDQIIASASRRRL